MAYLRDIGEKIYGSLYLGDNFAGKLPADLPDLADATRSNPLKDDDLDPAKQYAIWFTEFPALGSLLPNPDGTFTYTPVGDGTETAKYRVLEYNAVVGSEGTITLITGASSVTLVIQDMLHAHTIEASPLVSGSYLITADMLHGHTLDGADLTTAVALTIADMLHAHSIDNVDANSAPSLIVADMLHGHTIGSLSDLTLDSWLQIQDMVHAHAIDNLTLTGTTPGMTLTQADIDAIAEAVWAKILTGPRIPGSAGSMLQDTTNRVIAAL